MAEKPGMLEQIGIGAKDEEAVLRAQALKYGNTAGRGMQRGIAGLLGRFATPSRTRKEGQDMLTASQAGITVEQLKSRRQLRTMQTDFTDDGSFDNRIKLAEQMALIAGRGGDMQTVMALRKQITDIKVEKVEFNRLEAQTSSAESKAADDLRTLADRKATGIPVIPVGVNSKDKNFLPSHAFYNKDNDTYSVVSPTGEVEDGVTRIVAYKPLTKGASGAGSRIGDKIANEAIQQMGGAKSFSAARTSMDDIIAVAEKTGNIADVYTAFTDPQAVAGIAGDIALKVDNGVRLLESVASAFDGSGAGTGTYTDKFSGKQIKDNEYAYNGVVVSRQKQKELFLEASDSIIAEGLANFPPETRAILAERGLAASKLKAMIMELAYLDARQQEPSNRGLSDNDIKAALQRIGAFASNPISFIDIQITRAESTLKQLSRLGDSLASTENHTSAELRDFIWIPSKTALVQSLVEANIEKLVKARHNVLEKQGYAQSPDIDNPTSPFSGKTTEDLRKDLAALQGAG